MITRDVMKEFLIEEANRLFDEAEALDAQREKKLSEREVIKECLKILGGVKV